MKHLLISIKITIAFCVIFFVGYVLVLWAVAAIIKPNNGQVEVLSLNGKVVGASNVGQTFLSPVYFWPRPSAVDYNGEGSGGSNKGNTNPEYLKEVSARIDSFMIAHPYLDRKFIPAEMVTASASGLDPHISIASAKVQAQRVAQARNIPHQDINQIVDTHIETPLIGVPVVNVLKLNIALDQKYSN